MVYAAWPYGVLCCVTFRFVSLRYVTLRYVTLRYVRLRYVTLHYITLHYITLHYVALHYVTLHYVTLRYITLRYVMLQSRYTEVVTETKRTVKREVTPPLAEPTSGGGLKQLDALLHDLSEEARHNTPGSQGRGQSGRHKSQVTGHRSQVAGRRSSLVTADLRIWPGIRDGHPSLCSFISCIVRSRSPSFFS